MIAMRLSCELLSNFVSLTDCKQLYTDLLLMSLGCELLSNFVSLTDCKQPSADSSFVAAGCELLSNFVSLTDCKQQNVSNEHNNRYLRGVCRIKNPAVMSDFLFALSALK